MRTLVRVMDEAMDGVARKLHLRLANVEAELVDVKRRLDWLDDLAVNTDLDIDDVKPRTTSHRARQVMLGLRRRNSGRRCQSGASS